MGVREYFEKHPEKDLKLQNLEIEFDDEKKELRFDPETEISDSDWQKMLRQLEAYRKVNNWRNFAEQAMLMKILKPENEYFADLKIDDQAWQGMSRQLKAYRENNNWWYFAWQAMHMKILKPENFADLKIDDQAWQEMLRQLKTNRENNNWWGFAGQAMAMYILAAEKVETTDQGLNIILQEEKFKIRPKKPRPERKKF